MNKKIASTTVLRVRPSSRRIRKIGVALLLSVLFLGVIAPAYAETYVLRAV